jgi:hypothetical protein
VYTEGEGYDERSSSSEHGGYGKAAEAYGGAQEKIKTVHEQTTIGKAD